jgi:predicted anti-sigma-YlaC factor YlaD
VTQPVSPAPLACARVRVLLESYVDGDLEVTDAGTTAAVRTHLATCDDCRRQYQQAVSLPFRLKALTAPALPPSLIAGVMQSIGPVRASSRRAWTLLVPEAALVAFILWYLSGLNGLAVLASGAWSDLQSLAGWGAGSAPLPSIPGVDVLLLAALIALAAIAAYHLSVLARLDPDPGSRSSNPAGLHERRRA